MIFPTVNRIERPAETVSAIVARARVLRTPCGAGTMVWHVWGKGRPLALLHGGHGSWSHWVRSVPTLAAHYQVVAADLPGCGDSADPPVPYTGDSLAAIVVAGLERIVPASGPPCHVVGFSFGSVLGALAAAAMGRRVASLTLVGTPGLGVQEKSLIALKRWRGLGNEDRIMAALRHNLAVLMFADEGKIDELALYLQRINTRRCRLESAPISLSGALRHALPGVSAALNVIWGEFDAIAYPHVAEREASLREIKPEVDFRVIPGAGHWVAYEAAAQFNATLLDLLRKVEGAPTTDRQ